MTGTGSTESDRGEFYETKTSHRALELRPDYVTAANGLRSYLSVGASRLLNELIGRARHEYISPYDLAIAFTGIEDHACALDHLMQAFSKRVMRIVIMGAPEFDGGIRGIAAPQIERYRRRDGPETVQFSSYDLYRTTLSSPGPRSLERSQLPSGQRWEGQRPR